MAESLETSTLKMSGSGLNLVQNQKNQGNGGTEDHNSQASSSTSTGSYFENKEGWYIAPDEDEQDFADLLELQTRVMWESWRVYTKLKDQASSGSTSAR